LKHRPVYGRRKEGAIRQLEKLLATDLVMRGKAAIGHPIAPVARRDAQQLEEFVGGDDPQFFTKRCGLRFRLCLPWHVRLLLKPDRTYSIPINFLFEGRLSALYPAGPGLLPLLVVIGPVVGR
jgi:hypothetical protein